MTEVWFTAGHLFGEREHADAVIERHNERVEAGDLVWILGNLAIGTAELPQIERLMGRKYLICGDRDPAFAAPHADVESLDATVRGYLKFAPSLRAIVTGRTYPKNRIPIRSSIGFGYGIVDLWHFAWQIGPAYPGDPYTAYRRPPASKERRWQICGDQPADVRFDAGRHLINVTVDAWQRPVHIDEIREIVRKGY